jgi:hypothetical protein
MDRRTIVTLNSFPELPEGGLESRATSSADERLLKARGEEVLRRLEQETEKVGSGNVMITVQDREISLIQSELARQAAIGRQGLPSGGLEAKFGTGITGGDV